MTFDAGSARSRGEKGGDGDGRAAQDPGGAALGGDYGVAGVLAAVVTATSDAVVVTSPHGVILEWNPAAERVYGYSRREALGSHVQVLYPAQSLDSFASLVDRAIRSGSASFDKPVVRKDGSVVEVVGTISAVRDDAEGVLALVGISRDVREGGSAP